MKKNLHLITAIPLLVITLTFLLYTNYDTYQNYKTLAESTTHDTISQRINLLSTDLNTFPRTSLNDIAYLAKLSTTIETLTNQNPQTNNLLEFMKQNTAYYQLIILDKTNDQILTIQNLNNNYTINQPTTKTSNEFIEQTKNLTNKTIIVSDITLETNQQTRIPTLTYATSIQQNDKTIGYILLKANANYFLEEIRRSQKPSENIYLAKLNGQYLANPDTTKEFNPNQTLYTDNPQLNQTQIENQKPTTIETQENMILIKYITISKGYFQEYSGNENNIWTLISITDKTQLKNPTTTEFLIKESPALLLIIILIITTLILKRKNEN
jgi:hypothetical protein